MTDHGEPWDNQGHHSNIYDANGDCIATVFNHRAHIIACVDACKGIKPDAVPELLAALNDISKGMAPPEITSHLDTESLEAFRGRMWGWSEKRARDALSKAYEEEQ